MIHDRSRVYIYMSIYTAYICMYKIYARKDIDDRSVVKHANHLIGESRIYCVDDAERIRIIRDHGFCSMERVSLALMFFRTLAVEWSYQRRLMASPIISCEYLCNIICKMINIKFCCTECILL